MGGESVAINLERRGIAAEDESITWPTTVITLRGLAEVKSMMTE